MPKFLLKMSVIDENWQLGSPEGKKLNLRVMSAELGSEREEYRCLNERVRDFC